MSRERAIRRIVVALDASPPSVAALEASAALAAALGIELVGVYVEDTLLEELSSAGFIREVDYFTGEPRALGAAEVAQQLRIYARRAREALRRAAEQRELSWSFHTVRGRPAVALLSFSAEADLITLGERSRTPGRGPGSTVRALVASRGYPVMVVRPGRPAGRVIRVLHDGSDEADAALETAQALGRAGAGSVEVLAAPREGEAAALVERLEARVADEGGDARIRTFPSWDAPTLRRILAVEPAGLVVVARGSLQDGLAELTAFLRYGGCPVLVVG